MRQRSFLCLLNKTRVLTNVESQGQKHVKTRHHSHSRPLAHTIPFGIDVAQIDPMVDIALASPVPNSIPKLQETFRGGVPGERKVGDAGDSVWGFNVALTGGSVKVQGDAGARDSFQNASSLAIRLSSLKE